jgi:protein-tyrosine phosphatase
MIDIHAHILPGMDTGIMHNRKALELANQAVEQGVDKLVATPSFFPGQTEFTFACVKDKVTELQELLDREEIELELLPGFEIYLDFKIVSLFKSGVLGGLNDSRYVLIELPMENIPDYTDELFFDLHDLGYTPIIAHPERNQEIRKMPNLLYKWIKEGSLAQLNAGSLVGNFGPPVEETAKILVENNLVHFLGSDLHTLNSRGECLEEAIIELKKLVGRRQGEQFLENSKAVINNEEVEIIPPKRYEETNDEASILF